MLKDLTMLSLQESLGATVTWPSCAPKKARSLSTVKKIPQSLGLAGHRISVRMVGLCSLLFSLSVLSINLIHRTWESVSQRRRPRVIFPHLLSSFWCKTIFHLTVVYYICTACVTYIVCMYCVHLLFVCGYVCSVSSGPFKRIFFNLARSSHLSWAVLNMLLSLHLTSFELLETWMALVWIWTNWSVDKVLIGELRVKTMSWTFGRLRKQKENDGMLDIAVSGIKFSFCRSLSEP